MDWIDLLWPMLAAACFLLGFIHALLWLDAPRQRGQLAFAVAALSVGAIALFELASFHAASPQAMAGIIRGWHVPIALMTWAIVYQVCSMTPHASRLLGGSVAGLRLLALVLNFTTGDNLNFASVDSLGQTTWLGATIAYPMGRINPFMVVAQASNLLLLVFLLHALYRTARTDGPRTLVFMVCLGWLLLYLTMVSATLPLILGMRRWPAGTSLSTVTAIVLLSGLQAYELVRARRMARIVEDNQVRQVRSRQDLERAASSAGLGLWQWHVGGDFSENPINRALLGHGEGQGGALQTLFEHAEEPARVRGEFEQAIRQPKFEVEYRIERPEGGHRWIVLRGSVEHDARGNPQVVQGVTADVTRRREEASVLRTLLEAAPSALLLVDEGGAVRYANAEAARVFGYDDADAMVGLRAEALMSMDVPADHAQRRHEFMVRERPFGTEGASDMYGQRRNGEAFPMEVRLSHLELGGEAHVMAAVTDLSARQKMEYEMAMERESIAHLARVTMLGELSGSLAHELNQPLTAILSNAQAAQRILHRDPSDLEQVQEILADIVDTDRRAGQVIGRLRSLLRREAREFVPLDINDVVQECVRLMRNDLLNRRVACRLNLMPGLPGCMGDPIQLQQVLMNLMRNASDALPDEPAERIIKIRTQRTDTGVCTEVVDSGSGIPADMLERIFTPFETTKPTGMGMGLAVCRTIVRAHGGRIWAENAKPRGARVSFELPVQG